MRECMAEGCPHPAAGASEWCRQHDDEGAMTTEQIAVEAVARALHAAMCDRPWESGSDAHRDSYLHHARIALYGLGWSGVEGDDRTEGERPRRVACENPLHT